MEDDLAKEFENAMVITDHSDPQGADDNSSDTDTDTDKDIDEQKPTEDDKHATPQGDDADASAGDDGDESEKPDETPKDLDKQEEDKPPTEEDAAPAPITKDDLKAVINDLRSEEVNSAKEIETATNEVLEAYYPKGLSNTLIDEQTGREIKTPQDVVELSGDTMSIEEATKWLMNEQYKLDKQVSEIKENAKQVAETTVRFRKQGTSVIERYSPLFDAYPGVQRKVYDLYMKQVKVDADKNVVLSAPDMEEFYDTFLEPYKLAFEQAKQKPATVEEKKEEPPKPSVDDRLDISGDGGDSEIDDPNDFVAQVKKELTRKD